MKRVFLQAPEYCLPHTISSILIQLMFEELLASPTLILTPYRKPFQEMNIQLAFSSLNTFGLPVEDRKHIRKN